MWRIASSRGFTLTEALTTMGVGAVLIAIAVPSFTALRSESTLNSVQREVMTALYLGRSGAIATSTARSVVFTPPSLIQIQNQAGTQTYYTRNLAVYGPSVAIQGSGTITATFDGRGLLTPATAVRVRIKNTNAQSKTIVVFPTGKTATG